MNDGRLQRAGGWLAAASCRSNSGTVYALALGTLLMREDLWIRLLGVVSLLTTLLARSAASQRLLVRQVVRQGP